jgi:integrase
MASSYLIKRANTSIYHFRVVIPKDLVSVIGKNAFTISTGIGKKQKAKKVCRAIKSRLDDYFNLYHIGIMKTLTIEEAKKVAEIELIKQEEIAFNIELKNRIKTDEEQQKSIDILKKEAENDKYNLGIRDFKDFMARAREITYNHGFDYNEDGLGEAYLILVVAEMKRRKIDIREQIRKDLAEDIIKAVERYIPSPKIEPPSQIEQQTPQKKSVKESQNKLLDVFNWYREVKKAEAERAGRKSVATQKALSTIKTLFEELLGKDFIITDMTPKIKEDFRLTYMKYPKNRRQKKELKNLSLKDIMTNMSGRYDIISNTTFNNNIKHISTFFKWASLNEYVEKNYFVGAGVDKEQSADKARQKFSKENLILIFNEENLRSVFEQNKNGAGLYWAMLIALFHGARLGEIAQLYLDDIKLVNGITCIDIQQSRPDQRLKNARTQRIIPLHPRVFNLKFMIYVSNLRKSGKERLFPTLNYLENSGYNRQLSYLFNEVLLKSIGLKNKGKKLDFHSFRHTFIDECKQNDIDELYVKAIVGHSHPSITYGNFGYGGDYEPKKLIKKMREIDYPLKLNIIKSFIDP